MAHKDKYRCFDELLCHEQAGAFEVVTQKRDSDVLVIAPHGGGIEPGTSRIARAIAGDDFCLYLFEGKRESCNYDTLHITSTRFDEPECLKMLELARVVVAVHGCRGLERKVVYVGGRNREFRDSVSAALQAAGYTAETEEHRYPGTDPRNICNCGVAGGGVQLELSKALRDEMDTETFAEAVRSAIDGG